MLLAIDTATRNASVALYDSQSVHAEITWHTHQNHTVELTPQIVQAMELAGVAKKDLQAIGIGLGPGSFTGLRVGMSVAKGLAFARKIPILGIPTLDAIACAYSLQHLPIYAVLSAGRGRYSVARYASRDGMIARVGDIALVNADGLIDLRKRNGESQALFCGEINTEISKKLMDSFGARVIIASPALNARRAGFLAELAWARLQRGESDDLASLAPIYATNNRE